MNSASFQSLVHEWYDPLFRLALSLCSDREQALDLTQNAFDKLAARPESLRDPTRAKTWLFSVVHREFIDPYRHRTRLPSTHFEGVPKPPDPSVNPRARSLDREAVLRALQALDETFRPPSPFSTSSPTPTGKSPPSSTSPWARSCPASAMERIVSAPSSKTGSGRSRWNPGRTRLSFPGREPNLNKDTVREILSAYRSNGADADDPAFADALRHCRHDPENARWLEEELAFDREVARALCSGETPTEGREIVLAQTLLAPSPPLHRKRLLPWLGGLAAALLLVLSLFTALSNDPAGTRFQRAGFSLAGLVEQTLPLSYEAPQFSALASWLAAREAPVPAPPEGRLAHEPTVGCKIFTDEEGGRVSLACFRVDGKLVHLFTFDDRTAGLLAGRPRGEWQEHDGLHTQVFEQNGHIYALATEADPASLESGLTGTTAVSPR